MKRVVFDTNVYISAILTPGNSREVLELARESEISLMVSEAILAELERVLRLKIHRSGSEIALILKAIRDISVFVSPAMRFSVVEEDDTDNRILECAVEGGADYIVSGDQHHLLSLKEFQGGKILSPAGFLEAWVIADS
jgi:uncharacterized protein